MNFHCSGMLCRFARTAASTIAVIVALLGAEDTAFAEGTKQLSPTASDDCLLHVNGSGTDFASYDGSPATRLYISIEDPANERIYFGFHRNSSNDYFRIKDPNGNVVYGPVELRSSAGPGFIANHAEAVAGPDSIAGVSGYESLFYDPAMAGDYYIEFNENDATTPSSSDFKVELFDITVANTASNTAIDGRVYSTMWGLSADSYTVPFYGVFFVYTTDSVVTSLNLNGIQPFDFNIFCNSYGVQNTGNPLEDRKSVDFNQLQGAEYKLFLNDPDSTIYPTGNFSQVNPGGTPTVVGCGDSYCLNVEFSKGGYAEVLLDLDGVAGYTAGTEDVLLADYVQAGVHCFEWDGLDGLGTPVTEGTNMDVIANIQAGYTNFPIYDAECNISGFIVDVVRPSAPQPLLFFDDSNLSAPSPSGTNLTGAASPAHTWGPASPGDCDGSSYSNQDLINTWWYANIDSLSYNVLMVVCPPVANNDFVTVFQDSTILINVLANDLDPDGNMDTSSVSVTGVTQPQHGTITGINASTGVITYKADSGYTGADFFEYYVCDNTVPTPLCDTAVVYLNIICFNDGSDNQITGTVFDDTDGDGTFEAGEAGEQNVKVWYYADLDMDGLINNADTVVDSTLTDANGLYVFTPVLPTTIDSVQIINGDDDGEQRTVTGTTDLNNTDLDLGGSSGSASSTRITGMRFRNVTIPQGASIKNAYLKFVAEEPDGGPAEFVIYGEDVDNSGGFTTADNDFSNRSATTDSVRWVAPDPFVDDAPYNTPDISAVLTAITGRSGWSSGNNLSIFLRWDGTGFDERQVHSFEGNPAFAVKLVYELVETPYNYITKVDTTTFPGGASPTTNITDTVEFSLFGQTICDRHFGFGTPATNNPPVANTDNTSGTAGTTISFDVSANDTDTDGDLDATSVSVTEQPTSGAVATPDGAGGIDVDYSGVPGFTGADTLVYQICDAQPVCDSDTLFINVGAAPAPPVAVNDALTVNEDTTNAVVGVQNNDSDPNADPLTTSIVTQPTSGGTASVLNGDSIQYTPPANFNGMDTIVYRVCDAGPLCDTAIVVITVNPVNDPPVAVVDMITVPEDTTNVAIDVQDNDTDPENDALTTTIIAQPTSGGTASVSNGDSLLYNPPANFNGMDTIVYRVCDAGPLCDTAIVVITVNPANDPPVALIDMVTAPEDTTNVAIDVQNNDTDPENDALTTTILAQPTSGGTASVSNGDSLLYNPPANFNGMDTVVYRVCDAGTLCDTAIVVVTVTPLPDGPVANTDNDSGTTGGTVSTDVSANDSDVDGDLDATSVSVTQQPTSGAVATPDGAGGIDVDYSGVPGFSGADTLVYQICDAQPVCDSDTLFINISANPLPPVAVNDALTVPEDTTNVIVDVQANDSDPNGDPLTTTIISQPTSGGTAILANADSIEYNPPANFNGMDTIVYRVCDAGPLCDTAIVVISVTPLPDGPVANTDNDSGTAGGTVSTNVSANDTDVDGDLDATSVSVTQQPTSGAVATPDGAGGIDVDYSGVPGFSGADTLVYQICDAQPVCDSDTLFITIAAPPQNPPVANADFASGALGTTISSNVSINDTDADGDLDATSVSIVAQSTAGAVATPDGTGGIDVDYSGIPTFTGQDTVIYSICDAQPVCDTDTLFITVDPLSNPPTAVTDYETVNEDVVGYLIDVTNNDTDPDFDPLTTTAIISQPTSGGTATISGNDIAYTPPTNFFGLDTLLYQVCDPDPQCDIDTVFITVNPQNDPPVANPNTNTVQPGGLLTMNVTNNDTDVDGDLNVNSVTTVSGLPSGATVVPVGSGLIQINYAGVPSFSGQDTLIYQVCDFSGACDTTYVAITVFSTVETCDNGIDDDGDGLIDCSDPDCGSDPSCPDQFACDSSFFQVTGTQLNEIDFANDTLTPIGQPHFDNYNAIGWNPIDGYMYGTDGVELVRITRDSVSVLGSITNLNGVPAAGDIDENGTFWVLSGTDIYQINLQTQLATQMFYSGPQILAGDWAYRPYDGNLYTINATDDMLQWYNPTTNTSDECPVTGIDLTVGYGAMWVANGNELYAFANSTGELYRVDIPNCAATFIDTLLPASNTDGARCWNAPTPLNDPPSPGFEYEQTEMDSAIASIDVLVNNIDVDGDSIYFSLPGGGNSATTYAGGTVTITGDSTIMYTPPTGFIGADTIDYLVCDNGTPTLCVTDSLYIAITNTNEICGNGLDDDGDGLIDCQDPDCVGSVDCPGDFACDSAMYMVQQDQMYHINFNNGQLDSLGLPYGQWFNAVGWHPTDGHMYGTSFTNLVKIDEYGVQDLGPITGLPQTPAAGDFDINGDLYVQRSPNVYKVDINTNTAVQINYTGPALEHGDWAYRPSDGLFYGVRVADSKLQWFDPVLETTSQCQLSGINNNNGYGAAWIANGVDLYIFGNITGEIYRIDIPNCQGHLVDVIDPADNIDGARCWYYESPYNDPPLAGNETITLPEDSVMNNIDLLANNTDVESDSMFVSFQDGNPTATATYAGGTVTLNMDGTVNYTPPADFFGNDTLPYNVCDNGVPSACVTDTLYIIVTPVNDAPAANNDIATTISGVPVTDCVLANDLEVDGEPLTTTVFNGPSNGMISVDTAGCITYTSTGGFNGTDTVWYAACDATSPTPLCDTAMLVINVDSVGPDSIPCDTTFYMVQGAQLYLVNHNTGTFDSVGDPYTQWYNAMGYHPYEQVMYGTSFTNLVRIDEQGVIDLGPIIGLPQTPAAGDIDINGDLYVQRSPDVYHVDLQTNVATQIMYTGPALEHGDWAYRPADDKFYGVRTADSKLQWFDANTATTGQCQLTGLNTSVGYGAAWVANNTDLYLFANVTGEIYRVNIPNCQAHLADIVSPASNIDGAHCWSAPSPLNDPPNAGNETVTVPEDSTLTNIDLTANNTDVDNDSTFVSFQDGNPTTTTTYMGGTVTLNNDGTVDYTPPVNYIGNDTLPYNVCDDGVPSACVTDTLYILVTPVSDPPVAVDDYDSADPGVPVTHCVACNDSDPENDPLTVTIVSGPSNGTGSVVGTDSLVYTPNITFTSGLDTIVYAVCDTTSPTPLCDTALFIISVPDVPAPPIAANDSTTMNEDAGPATVDVLGNDYDINGDSLTVTLPSGGTVSTQGGTVGVNGDGTISYDPPANFTGMDTLIYIVCDPGPLCDTAEVFITVLPVNDAPLNGNEADTTNQDVPIPGIDLLANNSDPEGDSLLLMVPTLSQQGGSITDNGNGTIDYTPPTGFFGSDVLVYQVCDNGVPSACVSDTLFITVNQVFMGPIAENDTVMVNEDDTTTICVLVNDAIINSQFDTTSVAVIGGPGNGTVTVDAAGCIEFIPDPNWNGTDTITYVVCDTANPAACDTAMVFVTVTPVNDPPVAGTDTVTVNAGDTTMVDVTGNDTDPDGNLDPGSVTIVTPPTSGGVATVDSTGTITIDYSGVPGFNGPDTLVYAICDSVPECDTAMVIINVTMPNDPPIAGTDSVTVNEDDPGTTIDLIGNDTDPNGNLDPGSVTILTGPTSGTATTNGTGGINYTPGSNFNGVDSLTYVVCDSLNLCDTATVYITVSPVNDPPIANDNTASTSTDVPVTVDVVANDSDPNDPLGNIDPTSVQVIGGPLNGTATVDPVTGAITYTPNAGFSGNDTLTYVVCDDGFPLPALCDTAVVFITVSPTVNQPPLAANDLSTTAEGTPITIDALGNDTDPDGNLDPATVGIVTPPTIGTATVNNTNGQITYTPPPGFSGLVTFTYVVCDDGVPQACDTATVNITVVPAPIANNDSITGVQGGDSLRVPVLGNDTIGTLGTIGIIGGPTNGGASFDPVTNTLSYLPDPGFTGTDSVTYVICEPTLNQCDTATVYFIIEPAPVVNFMIPQGFSPNGDGVNDVLVIEGLELYPAHRFEVINRWGNKVYEGQPYLNDWDGTSNVGLTFGDQLPVGTYFYIFDPGDGSDVVKGFIYLSR